MKKLLTALMLIASTMITCQNANYAQDETDIPKLRQSVQNEKSIELLPAMASESSAPNRIWVGTFPLVWNELINEIVQKPIKFAGQDSENARLLNKQDFNKNSISSNSYYVKSGTVSPELKEEIESALKTKFNETSDILNDFDWSENPLKIFVYAMLKKDFKFLVPFDKLPKNIFGENSTPIEYFGINKNSSFRLYKNVNVLFYNDYNDFAVKLFTKTKDTVILYRTDEDTTFDKYYEKINETLKTYKGNRNLTKNDTVQIPDLKIYLKESFPEFEGRRIKGTDFVIDKTIETVDFKMNKEGVKLKSEAAILTKMSLMPSVEGRYFNLTDNYVLFLVEKNKKSPYFAIRVHDVETLNNTTK